MVASEAEGRAEALRRIAACRTAQAEELDLGGLQLTALDGELLEALCQLGSLRRLFLGVSAEARERPEIAFTYKGINSKVCNALSALPGALFDALPGLEQLDLSRNRLRDLPVSAENLSALTNLDLAYNSLGAEGTRALRRSLAKLTSLDLSYNNIGHEGALALGSFVNLTRLNLTRNDIGNKGAQALKGLINLTSLDLSVNGIWDDGMKGLEDLVNLTSLCLDTNSIGPAGAQALKGLTALTSLDLTNCNIGPEGAQAIRGLINLTSLNLSGNGAGLLTGMQALEGLVNLNDLNLHDNYLEDQGTQVLKGLVKLTRLNLASNYIRDEGTRALKGLINLTNLDLSNNAIGPEGTRALKGLINLTNLDLSDNEIGAEGAQALKGLVNLTRLNLADNDIGAEGAQALKGLVHLTSLRLNQNDIRDEGAQALMGLVNLTDLDLAHSSIRDISSLVSLRNLHRVNLSGCRLDHVVPAFWMLPSLQVAILDKAGLPGVPAEILSNNSWDDNCLDRLRAHLADLAAGDDVLMGDVKLMILGNGRVGKTQICRRLRGESFDAAVPSTHGIQVSSVVLARHVFDAPVTLNIWDFGGQDIYHGTHALFLKARAVFPLVWTPESEAAQFHSHAGFTFRNQPLAYWLAYVRTFGGARSPVLVIQSQCDRPEDEHNPPLPPGALDGFGYRKILHYSARGDGTQARGHAALEEILLDAVQWMRRDQGVAWIGPGRATVKAALEAKPAAGERLISYQGYLDLCAEVEHTGKGRISDPALLLDYLHDTGTVFYREGLFGNRIILDQGWALDAVYAVFDRASQSVRKIERNHGRFRRSELAEWVWQTHGVPEQELFLSFMQQCGICFTIQNEDHEKRVEAEYIAPDLLPARSDDETQKRLKLVWDEASPDAEAVLTFALLPPGLMRALIARIGGDAGLAAEYWRDGVCFYDEKTASRALIEQRWTEGWAGELHIATKRGQAGVLLKRLLELVENDRISLGARPSGKNVTGVEAKAEARETPDAKADEEPVRPAHEPSKVLEYYISYAWGDDTPEGKERAAVVDRLCSEAEARGKHIIRDKTAMKIGDRISTFMDRIGKGVVNGRVCIVLSDKYLKSAYCMHELFDVWRNCREDSDTLVERTRVLVLPSAKISTAVERAQYVIHWQSAFKAHDALVREHGQFVLSDKDNAEFRLMSRFVSETANVLQLVQDILRPRSFDDYVNHVFD